MTTTLTTTLTDRESRSHRRLHTCGRKTLERVGDSR